MSKELGADQVLQNVSIRVDLGEVVGLVGENGSGKTMLMRAVLGLLRPSEGEVWVSGKRLGKDCDFPPDAGILIENPALLPQFSARKNLELLCSLRNKVSEVDIDTTIRRVGLNSSNKKPVKTYSLGMKQRLGIAEAIIEKSELVVLDEPTNALDEDAIELVKQIIKEEKERGAAVLVSSHDSDFIEAVCDRTYTMRLGKVVGHA